MAMVIRITGGGLSQVQLSSDGVYFPTRKAMPAILASCLLRPSPSHLSSSAALPPSPSVSLKLTASTRYCCLTHIMSVCGCQNAGHLYNS